MGYFDGLDQAYIDAMDQAYNDVDVKRGNYVKVPDGDYQAYIDQIMLKDSKRNPGEFGLSLKLIIIGGGKYAGAVLNKYTAITVDRVEWLKRDLEAIGFELGDEGLRALENEERLRDMLDVIVDLTVKRTTADNGREYMNVYFNSNSGVYDHFGENTQPTAAAPWGH